MEATTHNPIPGRKGRKVRVVATVRDAQIQRAFDTPDYDDMSEAEIRNQIDGIATFWDHRFSPHPELLDYPWWWGQLEKDRPKQAATPTQRRTLEMARAAKGLKREEEAESYKRAEERARAAA